MKKVAIVTFDQFTDIDVFLPWDLLNRVRMMHDKDFQIKFVGTEKSHKSVSGIDLATHGQIEECNDADFVYFASGPGTRNLIKDIKYLSRFSLNPQNQIIGSMCSGALIIGALGHLKGLSATTYPTAFELLKKYDVKVIEDTHIVKEGNIATAAGCLAAVDLISWAIEKMYDKRLSDDVMASVVPNG